MQQASWCISLWESVRPINLSLKERKPCVCMRWLPSIAAMEKEYEQGKRGKVFLGEYYALLKESGAGGGIVLNEYLKCLSDEELLLEENVSNIGNISIFDPVLFDRLVKGIKKVEGENKKLGNRLNTSVMKSLSACFATCVKEKDEKALEGILGVKAGLGNLENGMSAMMGGGKSYLPAEQLRLDFYSNNRLDDKFKTLMSEYMIAQQQENSIDSLRKTEEITNRHFEMLIDSARMKNDSAAIVSIRKTMGMASLFGGVKYKLLSSFVISATRHYWKITDQQNVGEKKEMYRLGKLCLSVGSNSGDGGDVRICWKRSGRNKELKSFF